MGRLPAPRSVDSRECEPVDLVPLDVEPTAPLRPARPIPRRVWIAVGVAIVVAWAAVAFVTRDASHDAPRTPIDALAAGVVDLGSGRFGAVVDNQLFVIGRDRPGLHTPVPLGPGPIGVTAQSGDSFVVRTSNGEALAFTTPVHSEIVPQAQRLFPSETPRQWWMQRFDDVLAPLDRPGEAFLGPARRALAAVPNGFVATTEAGELELVTADGPRALQFGTFLASSGSVIAAQSPCSMGSCDVIVRDVYAQTVPAVIPMFETVLTAAIEPTGEHVALETGAGETVLVDIRERRVVSRVQSELNGLPGAPFTWLPGGQTLLVTQPGGVAVVRASDGVVEHTIPVPGVQQIFALP
jgi:hypothetical protein